MWYKYCKLGELKRAIRLKRKGNFKTKCTFICLVCSSVVETPYPEASILERCPVCSHKDWEVGDLMMADAALSRFYHDKKDQRIVQTN
jgi:hypothetical protein